MLGDVIGEGVDGNDPGTRREGNGAAGRSAGVSLQRGCSTAHGRNVSYRVRKIDRYLRGEWLDVGCADGGYAEALLSNGLTRLVGVDIETDRVRSACARGLTNGSFLMSSSEALPFRRTSFDGAFMNEVIEHVADEDATLRELWRVLRPGGVLVLISPNRWFPFEGHTVQLGRRELCPTPLVPWLPTRLTKRMVTARNYWPRQLVSLVERSGFDIDEVGFVWPVLDVYQWLPRRLRAAYQRRITCFDSLPAIRRFGVSTLVVARRARSGPTIGEAAR